MKKIVTSRNELVNLLAKLEFTKDQASVNAYRQAFKKLKELDLAASLNGYQSPLVMLRKEVLASLKKKRK